MKFPDGLSADRFLHEYWQKQPLFIPQGVDTGPPMLTPDELAWLATLEDVESRLIFTDASGEAATYELRHGPFSTDELASLPESDWTLLVQDVEKHLPDFRRWFGCAWFVPDWRIDDLMVSFAAPGGSAGPHRDNYDVFLCQGTGRRNWQIAGSDVAVREKSTGDLTLLEPFRSEVQHLAAVRDVLYLPPDVPHWGIATEKCLTYSVGMRAPDLNEIRCGVERLYPELRWIDRPAGSGEVPQQFFRDPDRELSEAVPGLVSPEDIGRARAAFPQASALDDAQFVCVLGCVATDPKAWLAPDTPDEAEQHALLRRATSGPGIRVHGMARVAWHDGPAGRFAFANGNFRPVLREELGCVQDICRHRRTGKSQMSAVRHQEGPDDVLRWLIHVGVFDSSEVDTG